MPIKFQLKDLDIQEVSFVERPDNAPARVLIYKADPQKPTEGPEAEEAASVTVEGDDLYVMGPDGSLYLISEFEVVGDEITGTIVELFNPAGEQKPADGTVVAPVAPAKPAPALKSEDPDARALAMARMAKADPSVRERLKIASEAAVLEERREDVHPVEKLGRSSSVLAKLRPAIYSTMQTHGVSWEVALGKIKKDPRYYGLVSEYQEEMAQLRAG